MEQIVEILESIKSGVDYSKEDKLVTSGILDSIDITELVSILEEEFDIEIGMDFMRNENFDSVSSIWRMVRTIQEA